MKRLIRKRTMTARKEGFGRICVEGLDFKGTTLHVADAYTYEVNLETQVIRLKADESLPRKGTVSFRKKKNSDTLIPRLELNNNQVRAVLKGHKTVWLKIYEDGFEITPCDEAGSSSSTPKRGWLSFKRWAALQCFAKTPSDAPHTHTALADLGYTWSTDDLTTQWRQTPAFHLQLPALTQALKTLRLVTAFSGVGTPEMALKELGVQTELLAYCEKDKHADASYRAIHEVDPALNLGDITTVDLETLPQDVTLFVFGSPCTDFSIAGKSEGGNEGSGTRSSLMWNAMAMIRQMKPTYTIWENVTGIKQQKHRHNMEKYLETMASLGYHNSMQTLNAIDYGLPQNRPRVFVVSSLTKQPFAFPKPVTKRPRFSDYLDNIARPKALSERPIVLKAPYDPDAVYDEIKQMGFKPYNTNTQKKHQSNDVYHVGGWCRTLCASDYKNPVKLLVSSPVATDTSVSGWVATLRTLSPREYWRLMGFSTQAFDRAATVCSDTQLYKQAGNAMALPVIKAILKQLLQNTPYLPLGV